MCLPVVAFFWQVGGPGSQVGVPALWAPFRPPAPGGQGPARSYLRRITAARRQLQAVQKAIRAAAGERDARLSQQPRHMVDYS